MVCRTLQSGGLAACFILALFAAAWGANDTDDDAKATAYGDIVQADKPVAHWRFDQGQLTAEGTGASLPSGAITGNVKLHAAGPQKDKYPGFDAQNEALEFDGTGSIRIADPGDDSPLDFDAGESITLEAWVNPAKVGQMYIVGKGRTANPGQAADNQNYALRLFEQGGAARLNFLFRSSDNRKGLQDDWHRWTSTAGFGANSGWHHVAVTYTFGKPDSLRGYIDGKAVSGNWDYGGKTAEGPVVDNDEVWIGSGMGGARNNSFHGKIDEVAIYRTALSAQRIAARWQVVPPKPYITNVPLPRDRVLVEVLEGIPDDRSWSFIPPVPTERFEASQFALVAAPRKYNQHGVQIDRSNPYVMWMSSQIELPPGEQRILLRSRTAARLYLDDELIVENEFQKVGSDGHNPVEDVVSHVSPKLRAVQPGDSETVREIDIAPGLHRLRLEVYVGGKNHRPELGELSVSLAPKGSDDFRLLALSSPSFPLTDDGWQQFEASQLAELTTVNQQRRKLAAAKYEEYWNRRHQWARKQMSGSPAPQLPAAKFESAIHNEIDRFVNDKLAAAGVEPLPLTENEAFLRRIYLDTLGVTPSAAEVAEFLADKRPDRRNRLIDALLDRPGWADNWVGYWQDVLAENPNLVKPSLNNTGPFRTWIHEALLDNKPVDRFATDLALMEGSLRYGGPGGFAMASENDAPFAAKAHILSRAFLGMEMQCARCHDAPFHPFKQEDLFNLAAMLGRGPQTLPKTSTIPGDPESHRSLIVKVSLKPGQKIEPHWPQTKPFVGELPSEFLLDPTDEREELALRMTSPLNPRFAQIMVNRVWQRYFGRGIVESSDDWNGAAPSHPELLDFLARELVAHDYDLKHVARLIFRSHAYQRQATSDPALAKLFAGPMRRRMSAEQILDSLFAAAGKGLHVEELNFDVEGIRSEAQFINLGRPTRAWQFASLSNERDRPSLSLPAVQTMLNLLEAFGWRASRQDPLTIREQEPTVLQPAILANGVAAKRIAQLSEDSAFTAIALQEQPVEQFVDQVYRQILAREPQAEERELFVGFLNEGYADRRTGSTPGLVPGPPKRDGVSWSNHLHPKANAMKIAFQTLVEQGDPPTTQLTTDWRERAEDFVWTLINSPEFVLIP